MFLYFAGKFINKHHIHSVKYYDLSDRIISDEKTTDSLTILLDTLCAENPGLILALVFEPDNYSNIYAELYKDRKIYEQRKSQLYCLLSFGNYNVSRSEIFELVSQARTDFGKNAFELFAFED